MLFHRLAHVITAFFIKTKTTLGRIIHEVMFSQPNLVVPHGNTPDWPLKECSWRRSSFFHLLTCVHGDVRWTQGGTAWPTRSNTRPAKRIYHSRIRLLPHPHISCTADLIPWVASQQQPLFVHQASLTLFGLLGNQPGLAGLPVSRPESGSRDLLRWGWSRKKIKLKKKVRRDSIENPAILQNRSRNRIGEGQVRDRNISAGAGMWLAATCEGPLFRHLSWKCWK